MRRPTTAAQSIRRTTTTPRARSTTIPTRSWPTRSSPSPTPTGRTSSIRLEPRHAIAYYNRGYAYRWMLNDPDRALADFEMAAKLRPMWAEAHCELGSTRLRLGDAAGGLVAADREIELDPTYA